MRTYTKREIAHLLKVSPRTVADDAKFLNLNPTQSDRGLKLFSQADLTHGSPIFERGGHIELESINEEACSHYERTS